MEDNKLTIDEKAEIFEYVNNLYLKLTGEKKKYTKRCFKTSWKEDNMCYKLLLKLYDVYDVWVENECHDEWTWERENITMEGTISQKKHHRVMNMMRESERELELELEKIQEGKGYISEEVYNTALEEKDKENQQNNRENGDLVAKLRNQLAFKDEKLDHANKRLEAQKLYYEDQMKKLNTSKD